MNRTTFFLIAFALVIFGASVRLLPHLPNATPLAAIALVSGVYLKNRWSALLLPAIALLVSDFVIGFYDWRIMASVYASFVLTWFLIWLASKYQRKYATGGALVISSLLFFLITNGAVWLFSPWYAKSFAGLLYAYELGLPFLRNMFFGDVFYATLLVVVFETARLALRVRRSVLQTI